MAKLTLTDLANLENQTSAVANINENNTRIEAALENTLSRDGSTPNTMVASLDMNSNPILNLPAATSSGQAVRYDEFNAAVMTGLGLATTGIVVAQATDNIITRTITGTSGEVTVTNGSGTAGNPILSLPDALDFSGKTITGGSFENIVVEAPTLEALDSAVTIQDDIDPTKQLKFQLSGISTGTTRTLTIPDASTTLVGTDAAQTLTGKSISDSQVILTDNNFALLDNVDQSKVGSFEMSGITTGTQRTLSFPNANTTIVGTDVAQTLTNKTLTSPVISTITNTGTITLPTATDTLVGRTTTDTLTNKTLTSPTMTTPTLGVATATSVNKLTITAPATSATLTVANGKTLTASNTLTLAGTDSTTMTFPSTTATVARIDAAQSFTGVQTFSSTPVFSSGATVTGTLTFGTGTITGLTNKTTPDQTNDYVIIYDSAGTAVKKATVGSVGGLVLPQTGTYNGLAGITIQNAASGHAFTQGVNSSVNLNTYGSGPAAQLKFAPTATNANNILDIRATNSRVQITAEGGVYNPSIVLADTNVLGTVVFGGSNISGIGLETYAQSGFTGPQYVNIINKGHASGTGASQSATLNLWGSSTTGDTQNILFFFNGTGTNLTSGTLTATTTGMRLGEIAGCGTLPDGHFTESETASINFYCDSTFTGVTNDGSYTAKSNTVFSNCVDALSAHAVLGGFYAPGTFAVGGWSHAGNGFVGGKGTITLKNATTPSGGQTGATILYSGSGVPRFTDASGNDREIPGYRTGTWTPTFIGSTTAGTGQTYGAQVGSYEVIGRQVTLRFNLIASSLGTAAGNLIIGGLPFASANTTNDVGIGNFGYYQVAGLAAGSTSVNGYVNANSSQMVMYQTTSTGVTPITITQAGSSVGFTGVIHYHI